MGILLLNVLMLLIIVACVATLYTEGMWSNGLMLINVVFAVLLAINFFEPLARFAESQVPSFTYFWDFLSLWGIFFVALSVLRVITDQISKTKVRFLALADRIGSPLLATLVGCVVVGFTMMTLHASPMSEKFAFGGFDPNTRMCLGTAPDRTCLGFAQRVSLGAYSRSASEEDIKDDLYRTAGKPDIRNVAVFDARREFIRIYAMRRASLEEHVIQTHAFRVLESSGVPER